MTSRELRTLTEVLRCLGYGRPISLENFRAPNFALVADILYWLVLRYEPGVKIPDDIDTESQRVQFLAAAAAAMASKARIQCVCTLDEAPAASRRFLRQCTASSL